ncbi:hypothetical protein ABZV14_40505 [Streptosporangium canum]|uniref:hypothetical protein n=1 Tax=Streptosporangium TaxID=2000 RepID=UPI0004CD4A17|nr:hypothetical protein [Streptosporangium roseum]
MTRSLKALGDRMLNSLLPSTTADASACTVYCWCYHWLDHTAYTCQKPDCTTTVVCYECC